MKVESLRNGQEVLRDRWLSPLFSPSFVQDQFNSLSHLFGTRRFDTDDTSKNNWLLAILTLGEGWNNNHHHFMASARPGFFWWEIDITYYLLKMLSWVGLVWDLRRVPKHMLAT